MADTSKPAADSPLPDRDEGRAKPTAKSDIQPHGKNPAEVEQSTDLSVSMGDTFQKPVELRLELEDDASGAMLDAPREGSSTPEKDSKSPAPTSPTSKTETGDAHRPGMGVPNPEIYPKGNVAYTRGWEPGDPPPKQVTLVDGVAYESEQAPDNPSSPRPEGADPSPHSDLSDENKRFLESDLAKQVRASPEFRQILEDQQRVRDFWKGAKERADDIRQHGESQKAKLADFPVHDPLADVLDEIEERRAIQESTNKEIAAILERDESDASEPPKRKGMDIRNLGSDEIQPSTEKVQPDTDKQPLVNLLCFWFKALWQFNEHRLRSIVLTAIPAFAWTVLLGVVGLIQGTSGKPADLWLQEHNLPAVMTFILAGSVIMILLMATIVALIVLPRNPGLEAARLDFDRLTSEQKEVLRRILPLGGAPYSIPQSDRDNLEHVYQTTRFVTRHEGYFEINKDLASRLELLLKCDEVRERRQHKTPPNAQIENKDIGSKRQVVVKSSEVLPEAGALQASRMQRVNDWREMIAEAQRKFKGSGLSLIAILEQDSRFEGFRRHLSTGAIQTLRHGTGVRSMDEIWKVLEDEIIRVEENWGLR